MTAHDLFEQRAASAGASLRSAFLGERPAVESLQTSPSSAAVVLPHRQAAARRGRRGAPAAAALAAAAAVVAAFALTAQRPEPVDVLGSGAAREKAVLAPPYLVGAGTLPAAGVHSVRSFPVPFTFSAPPAGERWSYRTGEVFDVGLDPHGVLVLAPVATYTPSRSWRGQSQLAPAPTDADGWEDWLEDTGHVDVTRREELVIGGAPATRFSVEVDELPDAYDGCGGGRRCVAVAPFADPSVGPGRVGVGPQVGLDDSIVELTVIELADRAVLALVSGGTGADDDWLPRARRLIDSLRFA